MAGVRDELVSAWFSVEFQGQIRGAFRECTGLGSTTEVVDSKASGPKGEFVMKKVPGRMKWNDITLKRGITDAMDLWTWRALVEQGKMAEARVNASITMYSQDGTAVARWDLVNAWPSELTGPSANAQNNEVAVEEIKIVHEGYKRIM